MKNVDVIDRSVVDNFIDRIIVCGDGKIIVILKFDTVYENLITPRIIYNTDSVYSNLTFIHHMSVPLKWNALHPILSVRCSDRA